MEDFEVGGHRFVNCGDRGNLLIHGGNLSDRHECKSCNLIIYKSVSVLKYVWIISQTVISCDDCIIKSIIE